MPPKDYRGGKGRDNPGNHKYDLPGIPPGHPSRHVASYTLLVSTLKPELYSSSANVSPSLENLYQGLENLQWPAY
jgi:hypothetical protein